MTAALLSMIVIPVVCDSMQRRIPNGEKGKQP